jgi:cytochrome bd-type quinol oxidase subunit 1
VKAVVLPPASQGGWMVGDRGRTLWFCQAHLRRAKSMQRTYGFSMRGTWVLVGVIVVVVLMALAVNWLSGG